MSQLNIANHGSLWDLPECLDIAYFGRDLRAKKEFLSDSHSFRGGEVYLAGSLNPDLGEGCTARHLVDKILHIPRGVTVYAVISDGMDSPVRRRLENKIATTTPLNKNVLTRLRSLLQYSEFHG